MVSMKPTAAYGIFFGMSSTSARISKETYMSDKVSREPSGTAPGGITAAASGAAARSMGAISVTLIRFAIVIGFFALWEIASGRWIEPFLISSPSRIFTSLISGFREGDLLQHSWVTLQEIAIGFPIGAISGIALGYSVGRSRRLAEIFEPIIVGLTGIPSTVMAPLL